VRLLKKSGGVLCERKAVKYACIQAHRNQFRVVVMCRALGVSRSGFYAAQRRTPSARAQHRESLKQIIAARFEVSRGTYGSPRIYQDLRNDERPCGRHLIARLMRECGLRAKTRRRYRPLTTDSKHGYGVARNLLSRRFGVQETGSINRAWCGDITYIRTAEGWLYLAVLLDLGSRMIVGWAMHDAPDSSLSVAALRMALARRTVKPGLLHHTDRGVQYAATDYRRLLNKHKLVPSMSRRANCYDNAVSESFFATLKRELLDPFKWLTKAAVRTAIFEYIEVWYNRVRRHSALGYLSPFEYEHRLLNAD
jgi:putative transposase